MQWQAIKNLVRNLLRPNCFRVGYIMETELILRDERIKQYQESNKRLLQEAHIGRVRQSLLEGSLKAVVAQHPRGCVYIPKEDVLNAAKRWRTLDTREKDGKVRFQVREDKDWRKNYATNDSKPTDNAGKDRGATPSKSDIVGT